MASVSKIAQYYSAFEPMSQSVFMWFMCARQGALSFISIPLPIFHGLNKICCCQTLLHAGSAAQGGSPGAPFSLLRAHSSFLSVEEQSPPDPACERVHFTSSLTLHVFTWPMRLRLPAELSNLLLLPLLS